MGEMDMSPMIDMGFPPVDFLCGERYGYYR